MERLLTLSFYFTSRPDPNFQHTKLVGGIVVLLFLASIAIRIYRKKITQDEIKKKILRRAPRLLQNYGSLLLLLLIARETGIPYFSMRIWGILLLLAFLCHAVHFMAGYKKEYRRRLEGASKRS